MRLSSRKAFPSRISFAASVMPSAVRKLKHPTSSSSPNTPQFEWAGAPGLIGSWEYFGILLKSNFATFGSLLFGLLHSVESDSSDIIDIAKPPLHRARDTCKTNCIIGPSVYYGSFRQYRRAIRLHFGKAFQVMEPMS